MARLLIGVGSSTMVSTRAYVTFATLRDERPLYLHLLASLRLLGLIGGPLLGFIFIHVDFTLWDGGPTVNVYTAPAFFCGLVGLVLLLVVLILFRDFKFTSDEELRTKSEREWDRVSGSLNSSNREYRAAEVTPLLSRLPKEKNYVIDRTGLLVANLMLLVVGASYSIFSVLQPLLSYDNFGWGIRENYIFFGVSSVVCVFCCALMPAILNYFDARAVVGFSLVCTAAGFFGRIHFAGTPDAWRMQFLAVTIALIVTGYTTCSVILFGLFTKQLALGESMFVVNVSLAFVNLAQAFTPIWAIALYNFDNEGNIVWGIMAGALTISTVLLLLFWKRFLPQAPPRPLLGKTPAAGDGGPGGAGPVDEDLEEVVSTFRYAHRESQSTLNQEKFLAWRASLSRHIPKGTPDSGYGYMSDGGRKRKPKQKKKRSGSRQGGADGHEGEESDDSEYDISWSTKSKKKSLGRSVSGGNKRPASYKDPVTRGRTTSSGAGKPEGREKVAATAKEEEEEEGQFVGGAGKGQGKEGDTGKEGVDEGAILRAPGDDDGGHDNGDLEQDEDDRTREGDEDDDDENGDDDEDGDGEEEEEGDDDDEDLFEDDDDEDGDGDASELDDAPEIATPVGSIVRQSLQRMSRKLSEGDVLSTSF